MKHVVTVDEGAFGKAFKTIWLAGERTGIESCAILLSRIPVGGKGPDLHVHEVDQLFFVVRGKAGIQIGLDAFEAETGKVVFLPAGTPHRIWNAGSEPEIHLEVLAPHPDVDRMLTFVEPSAVHDAPALFTPIDDAKWPNGGFGFQELVNRSTGSEHLLVNAVKVPPGSGGPPLHFHQFDMFYFILSGELDIEIGLTRLKAPPMSLVVFPAGVVHTNHNRAARDEFHLALVTPEPPQGGRFNYNVEIPPDA